MCILREERVVLVWNDSVEGILTHGQDVEGLLVGIVQDFCPQSDMRNVLTMPPDLGFSYRHDDSKLSIPFFDPTNATYTDTFSNQFGSGVVGKDGNCPSCDCA